MIPRDAREERGSYGLRRRITGNGGANGEGIQTHRGGEEVLRSSRTSVPKSDPERGKAGK